MCEDPTVFLCAWHLAKEQKNEMANNPDITHINIVEGLAAEIQSHLVAISPQTAEQAEAKECALNKHNAWQKNELFALRKEFEE